jgi:hypothetical protein
MSDPQVDRMSVMRHWLVYPDEPWRHSPAGPTVVTAEPARRHGYRIEGPFVPEPPQGAVEALEHIAESADHPSLTVRSTSYLGKVARDALTVLRGQ